MPASLQRLLLILFAFSPAIFTAMLVREKTATEWPQAVRDLAGAWSDLEYTTGLRRRTGRDVRRERF